MPANGDAEFEKKVLNEIIDYIDNIRAEADNFTYNGRKLIHRVARVIVAMAQTDDDCGFNKAPLAQIACDCLFGWSRLHERK